MNAVVLYSCECGRSMCGFTWSVELFSFVVGGSILNAGFHPFETGEQASFVGALKGCWAMNPWPFCIRLINAHDLGLLVTGPQHPFAVLVCVHVRTYLGGSGAGMGSKMGTKISRGSRLMSRQVCHCRPKSFWFHQSRRSETHAHVRSLASAQWTCQQASKWGIPPGGGGGQNKLLAIKPL